MGVAPNSPVSAANTNAHLLDSDADDATTGKLGLHNSDVASGTQFDNTQEEINGLNSFVGRVVDAGYNSKPTWTNNDVGSSVDDVKTRADVITLRFSPTDGIGHQHTGTAGDAPKLHYLTALSDTQLKGYLVQGTQLTGVTGGTTDVSTQLSTETPSTNTTTEGVVSNNPQNVVQLLDTNDNSFLDGSGNKVYGRVTNTGGLGGTWTLTYYSLVAGIETAYSFSGSNTVNWYYQKLFNETNRPVYTDQLVMVSDLLAGNVPDASPTVRGLVNTTTQSFAGKKSFTSGILINATLEIPKTDDSTTGSFTLTYHPFVRLTGASPITLQGVTAGADGKSIIIHNSSSVVVAITNEDAGATSTDRFHLPGGTDMALGLDSSVEFIYDSTASRWIIKSGSGSGSGSNGMGGINFVGMDSNWQQINTNDVNAETTVGNWKVYQDTAGVEPVDMNGTVVDGTPVVISRTTTGGEVLDGMASFKVVKPAANKQGEGVSVVGYVPQGWTAGPVLVKVPFKVISGTLVQGDLKFFLYDVVNGTVITPFNNDVVGSQGILTALLDVSTNTDQIRVGFHFASTSTAALTFTFDDVFVGPSVGAIGPRLQNEVDESSLFTFTGFGTPTAVSVFTRIFGNKLFVRGTFISGTSTAVDTSINLPSKYLMDSVLLKASTYKKLGTLNRQTSVSGTQPVFSDQYGDLLFFDGSDYTKVFVASKTSSNTSYDKAQGNTNFNSGETLDFDFEIPLDGADANITIAQSSTFNISNFLANGARVTGTPPTQLGQFRSYLRNAGAQTYTETNGSPAIPPTAIDGILLYGNSGGFASADSNNEPSKYEIFVGKNKSVFVQAYASTGKTGPASLDVFSSNANANQFGSAFSYDPTTGIFTIVIPPFTSSAGSMSAASDMLGNSLDDVYFDIRVSENALAVGIESPRSEVCVSTTPSTGAVNTHVRYFTVLEKEVGEAISVDNDSNNGTSFTINEDGVYDLSYSNESSASNIYFYITLNETVLNADPFGNSSIIDYGYGAAANSDGFKAHVSTNLKQGDVIRPMVSTTSPNNLTNITKFRVTKLSN